MADLQLDNVTKVFEDDDGEIVAVDDVSIDVEDGEFLVLVGPSGCGKSTTLRMIAGLESITSGTITLGGNVINGQRPQERDLAMVFQSYALYPHMTVRGNMAFGLEESTEMTDEEIDQRVTEAAEMMGIDDLLDRKPGELSGGQQQRVALGRAIVREPEAFLMDEPLANLDAKLRAQMRTELQRLQEELDVTTVYVTHDQTEAMTMSDRIAILNDGKLQQVGTPLECYHQPSNRFVAGFIGEPSMNTFRMEVRGDRLVEVLEEADAEGEAEYGFEYALDDAQRDAVDGHDHVVLGIRPEDITIDESDAGDAHSYEVTVDVVEPKGDENNVHVTFDPTAAEPETFIATVGGMRQVRAGDAVVARVPPEAIHLFDAETGRALHNREIADSEATESLV